MQDENVFDALYLNYKISGLDVQALCMEVEKMFQLFNCSAHEVPGVVGSYISLFIIILS